MPVLRDINPRFLEAATKAAALARDDEECLSEIADRFIEEHCKGFAVDKMALAGLPLAVSGRVARKLCGGGLSYKHVRAVLDLCTLDGPPTGLSLPGVTVYNEYGRLVFEYAPAADGFVPIHPEEGDCVAIPGLGLEMSCKSVVCSDRINKSLTSFLFKYDEIYGKITVRPRREGDAIRVFGRNGTKTLKKLFIEHHVPARERSLVPVIADDAGVLAVYEIGIGDRAVPAPGDLAFEIEFRKGLE
jgi:tRNA(Ile)-lysidine synthase